MEDGASKAASTYCDLQMTARTTPIASIILSFGVIMVDTDKIYGVCLVPPIARDWIRF